MPFLHTPAGEISDFDPERTSPEDVTLICDIFSHNLGLLAESGADRPGLPGSAGQLQHEIQAIGETARRPEIRACWRSHGHVDRLLGRLARLEQAEQDLLYNSANLAPPAHPLRRIAARHHQYMRLKREGKIFGIIQV